MPTRVRFICFAVLAVLLVVVVNTYVQTMTTVHVDEGMAENVGSLSEPFTLSGSLPSAATDIRFCGASVGLAGQLLIYRFSAPLNELHSHAAREFESHWGGLKATRTADSPSLITVERIQFIRDAYGVDAGWMLPPAAASGTLYVSADGGGGSRPFIFIDEANATLYFDMSD